MTASRLLVVTLALFAAGIFVFLRGSSLGADLMALWLAGHFLAEGQAELVYPPDMGIFTMYAPNGWVTYLRESHGYRGEVYPFLYPPLWAWLAAPISAVNNFANVAQAALAVNSALLMASIWLAIRIVRPGFSPLLYAVLAVALLMFTPIGVLALLQAQPQIFVSFLILLAIERSRAGALIVAGVALALAASIKLYPLVFVIFWLTGGQKRAVASFLVAGAGLAALSVAVAGWPLHQEFLHHVSQMSGTVFVTVISANLDAVIAQMFFFDQMTMAPALNSSGAANLPTGWYIMHRPALWSLLGNLAVLMMLALLAWAFRRAGPGRAYGALWPLALIGSALLAPFTWIYYFIPAAVLAPSLIDRLGHLWGSLFLLAGGVPMLTPLFFVYKRFDLLPMVFPLASVLAMSIWALGFILAACGRGKTD